MAQEEGSDLKARVPKDFHKRVAHYCTEHEISIKDAVIASLEALMRGDTEKSEGVRRISPENSESDAVQYQHPEDHAMLAEILDSEDSGIIAAVRANLAEFRSSLRREARIADLIQRLEAQANDLARRHESELAERDRRISELTEHLAELTQRGKVRPAKKQAG